MHLERGPEISLETFSETLHFYTFEEVLMEWMEHELLSLKYLACSNEMHFCTQNMLDWFKVGQYWWSTWVELVIYGTFILWSCFIYVLGNTSSINCFMCESINYN